MAMISMTCKCGGDFWVRDRLAGQSTQCPTCQETLAIPPMEVIETRMTPARCACGETFWSASWRPGRRTKCPVCGRAVGGPEPTTAATVSVTAHSTRSTEALPVPPKPKAPEPPIATSPTGPVEALRDRLGPRGPVLIGSLAAAAALGVFGLMLWGGGQSSQPPEGNPTPPVVAENTDNGTDLSSLIKPPENPPTTPPDGSTQPPEITTKATAVDSDVLESFRTARLRLIVPAYFYPGGPGLEHWDRLIASADRAPIVAVVNPSSGPGDELNADYAAVLRRADRAGLLKVGYVNTEYAKRPLTQVKDDVDRWLRFYPEIDGIFLDAQASSEMHLGYYTDVCAYVRSKIDSALIIANAGTSCDPAYVTGATADIIVMFENFQGFDAFRIPNALAGFEPLRFAAMPYAITGAPEMRDRIQEAVLRGIGNLYITDAGQSDDPETAGNPWGRLPTYWDEEIASVGRVNQRLTP